MTACRQRFVLIALLVFLALGLVGHRLYRPPLLSGSGWNLPGRIYDFFACSYHFTRAERLAHQGRQVESLRASARAAWHRPALLGKVWPKLSGDLFAIGKKYSSLGLESRALCLFRAAAEPGPPGEKDALDLVSYLALLDDWPAAGRVAGGYLEKNPKSAEAKYWLGRALLEAGRPVEARPVLRAAFEVDRTLIDSLYQAARAAGRADREEIALEEYREVAAASPGHLGAWRALERIYESTGEENNLQEVRARIGELTPTVPRPVKLSNQALLAGYDLQPSAMGTGESLSLGLYLRGWRPGPVDSLILIRLAAEEFSREFEVQRAPFFSPPAGVVVRQELDWENPFHLYPGKYRLEIALAEAAVADSAAGVMRDPVYHTLDVLELSPSWLPSRLRAEQISGHFGDAAYPLGKRTFLGPGSELGMTVAGEKKTAAVALVTSAQCYASFPQGREIARLIVSTGEGKKYDFPIRMGIETARTWWEGSPPALRMHRQAPVFRTWPIKRDGREFPAADYRAVFSFPEPGVISSFRVINVSANSGLYIEDIILIPEGSRDLPGLRPGHSNP